MSEPVITVNGRTLSTAEAMTIRVSINSFGMDLQATGLGDDEHGRTMTNGYLACIRSINDKIVSPMVPHPSEMFEDPHEVIPASEKMPDPECPECEGEGIVHDADFSDGDSDQKMFLMQDTMRDCPVCMKELG